MIGSGRIGLMAILAALAWTPAAAQITQVDPDAAIDGDLMQGQAPDASATPPMTYPVDPPPPATTYPGESTPPATYPVDPSAPPVDPSATPGAASGPIDGAPVVTIPSNGDTYREDDLIGAAEGLFGKGAKGVAELIQGLLKDQGEPNGYIVGREAGGAFVVGLRYGSGTLYHKVEGQRPVYWTGPSIGFDAGASAANTFILVYNLYDTEELYKRFPAGEGQAYFIGGFNVSYLRAGDVVLIPVRAGAGMRLGINAGYMKFTHEQKWIPF